MEEFDLRHRRCRDGHISRGILDDVRPPERILHVSKVRRDDLERFVGVRQRQQIIQVGAAMHRPRQVSGDEDGLQPIDERSHSRKMWAVDPIDAADRDAHRMYGDG